MQLILDMGQIVWYVLQSPLLRFFGVLAVAILVALVLKSCLDRGFRV